MRPACRAFKEKGGCKALQASLVPRVRKAKKATLARRDFEARPDRRANAAFRDCKASRVPLARKASRAKPAFRASVGSRAPRERVAC